MKNNNSFVAVFFIAALFFSCKKNDSAELNAQSSLVKTYTEEFISPSQSEHETTTYNLSYDPDGRITSMVVASSLGDKFVYHYNSDNTFTMDLYNANALAIHEDFFINPALSFVDSTFQYNDTHDTTTERYFYNDAKQLIRLEEYDYTTAGGALLSEAHAYLYDNNNDEIKDISNEGTTAYTYYPDLPNTLSMGQIYAAQSAHLVKTATYTSGSDAISGTHTYTFDNSNRLVSDTAIASNQDTVIKTYTY